SMMVLRAYPISLVYLGATPSEPTHDQELGHVRDLISGGEQPGLVGHFLRQLGDATLPSAATRRVRVDKVILAPQAASALPAYLGGSGVAETWLADEFSAAVLEKTGVPILPYSKGYAVGNTMSAHVADGTVYTLTIPEADYSISLELQSLKEVKFAQVAAGTSFIYG